MMEIAGTASIPFVATAIFIAHPAHVEVVANIKSIDEIMGMLGGVLALLFSLNFLENKKIINLVLSFFFFLFGLFSKESAITFLAIVPLTLFVFRKASFKEHAIVLCSAYCCSIIYFGLWYFVTGNTSGHAVSRKIVSSSVYECHRFRALRNHHAHMAEIPAIAHIPASTYA